MRTKDVTIEKVIEQTQTLDEKLMIILSSNYIGKVVNISKTAVHIEVKIKKIQRHIEFSILEEQYNQYASYVGKEVNLYVKIKHDFDYEKIEGVKIVKLNPIEKLDSEKVETDFQELVRKINDPNYTDTILKLRHDD